MPPGVEILRDTSFSSRRKPVANDEKTFAALLSEAPLSQKSDTVTLTGALARSPEEGKFVLMQGDGSSLTLDTDAVKSHTVLGGSFGQQIVQVELDPEKVPKEVTEQTQAINPLYVDRTGAGDVPLDHRPDIGYAPTLPLADHPFTNPLQDHPFTNPFLDHPHTPPHIGADVHTGLADVHTGAADVVRGMESMPLSEENTLPSYDMPFALATGHQAPADTLAQMNAMAYANPLARTRTDWDSDKSALSDGTYPIRLPNGHTVWHLDF